MFKNLKRIFFGAAEDERQLLEQFYTSLNAMYLKAKKGNINLEEFSEVSSKIEKLLQSEEKSWRNAYQVEQLMPQIFDDETLEIELGRRLVDAKYVLNEDTVQFYTNAAQSGERAEKHALIDRLINDLQWRYQLRQLKRNYKRLIRIRTSTVFVLSVLVFFMALALAKFDLIPTDIILYATAITSGWFGAAFSMLIGLRDRLAQSGLDELRVNYRYDFLASRVVIGIGAAFILYFFLRAELLTGSVFPDLNSSVLSPKDASLFVIWTFIAGFSEKFVPNLLAKAEEKADVKN